MARAINVKQGAHGDDRERRRRARHGRRPRLWREPVQPRHQALRQPGSSFKVYTYAAAMENGFTPDTVISDAPVSWRQLVAAELRPQLCRPRHAPDRDRQVDQHRAGAPRQGRARHRVDRARRPRRWASKRRSAPTRPCRSAPRRSRCSTRRRPMPSSRPAACRPRRHGISQILNYDGEILYDFDRDAPPAKRVRQRRSQCQHERHADPDPRISARHAGRRSTTASTSAARPARRRPIATPGSSASPAITRPPSGSATTTIPRPTT